jgi:hypothetical protein
MIISLYSPTQQSGKSTVASYLVDCYGFSIVKFAEPIYDMVFALAMNVFDENRELAYRLVYDDKEAIWPVLNVSTRTLLRTFGTEWGRDTISESIWADIAKSKLIRAHQHRANVVFDDNRFSNEILMLREFDTKFVRTLRPEAYVDRSHQSEGLLDAFEFDYTIMNNGSLWNLYRQIDSMMEVFVNGQ